MTIRPKLDWFDNDGNITRQSVNKSAMDSFEDVLRKQVSSMVAKGKDAKQIAKDFHLPLDYIKSMVNPETKIACACEGMTKEASAEPAPEDNGAAEAYEALHGKPAASYPDCSKLESRRGKSIHSAMGNQSVTDMGGPQKQMKFQSSNTIFNPDAISEKSKEKDNGERIREEKAAIRKQHEEMKLSQRNHTIDGESLSEALKKTELRKDSNVQNLSAQEAHKYSKKMPMKGMSIFDTKEFERVPDKTAGEIRREEIKTNAGKKDRSWAAGSEPVTSKSIFNKMIDSLTDKKE